MVLDHLANIVQKGDCTSRLDWARGPIAAPKNGKKCWDGPVGLPGGSPLWLGKSVIMKLVDDSAQ